ncbi:MAG TPA: hypothetical protein VGU27_01105 [Candidatus Eisenbacteria bacterium]|nr:hypothetical protein [Candidatus Eisenbacteria bacterium]
MSHDPGVWVAALLTLAVFSFLYKDNPFYKLAEHLFVGVSAGYYIVLNFWTVVVPNLWDPLVRTFAHVDPVTHVRVVEAGGPLAVSLGDYRALYVIPALLGLILFTRLSSRVDWVSRWSLALIIGVYAGLKTTGFAQGDLVAQVQASLVPLAAGGLWPSVNAILFTAGLIGSLLFFFYSREHRGALGVASRVGIAFLMVSFGAGYGYTVMSRISLLIGRFQFLLMDWLGVH